MRILLLTQLFQPEPNHLKGLSYAKALQARGHVVEVLTGFPNYPGGQVFPGYRIRPVFREVMDGVRVTRLAMYPSHDRSSLRRMMNYASFAASAGLLGPWIERRFDVIHVYQGPATLVLPALALQARSGAPYVLDVQDLWPDSVTASGMLPFRGLDRPLDAWCRLTYRKARRIVVLSEGYRDLLLQRGVPDSKIDLVYNWCDEEAMEDDPSLDPPPDAEDPWGMKGRFNVVYAGLFGTVQALDTVVDAAARLEGVAPDVQFVLVGDGVERDALIRKASTLSLGNVRFVPRQSMRIANRILRAADAVLIHLKDDPLGLIGIPQKTQAYLAAGKPIVMATGGNAAELVSKAGAGRLCRPGDPDGIAEAVRHLRALPAEERRRMGDCGRQYYQAHLSFEKGVERMEGVYARALREERTDRRGDKGDTGGE